MSEHLTGMIYLAVDDPELASFRATYVGCVTPRSVHLEWKTETVDVGTVGPRVQTMCIHLQKYGLRPGNAEPEASR